MTSSDQRLGELLDRWISSLELHLRYSGLSDEGYWQVQPWPKHARPARWIIEHALASAGDLKRIVQLRQQQGDEAFAGALELMGFVANLVGVQNIERFIPLADPEHENHEALGQTASTAEPLGSSSTQIRALEDSTREMPVVGAPPTDLEDPRARRALAAPTGATSTIAAPYRPPESAATAPSPLARAVVAAEAPAPAPREPAAVIPGPPTPRPATPAPPKPAPPKPAPRTPAPPPRTPPPTPPQPTTRPPTPAPTAAAPVLSTAAASRPAAPAAKVPAPPAAEKPPARSAPPKAPAPRAPSRAPADSRRAPARREARGTKAAADSVESIVIADAVRLRKWGREWHELAESISRMAGRPNLTEVRRIVRVHKVDIDEAAGHGDSGKHRRR